MSLSSPQHQHQHQHHHHSPLPSPNSSSSSTTNPNPTTLTRSDPSNPYPTTFVQADTSSFKQVVQMLTGSTIPKPNSKPNSHSPPINNKSKPSTKLYERRNTSFKHHLRPLNSHMKPSHDPNNNNNNSPHGCGLLLSPSMLDFPGLMLSPVTPLIHDPFNRSPVDKLAEDKAIAEKGFFLHPVSPVSSEPRLLPLFPLTSPKLSSQSESESSDHSHY